MISNTRFVVNSQKKNWNLTFSMDHVDVSVELILDLDLGNRNSIYSVRGRPPSHDDQITSSNRTSTSQSQPLWFCVATRTSHVLSADLQVPLVRGVLVADSYDYVLKAFYP